MKWDTHSVLMQSYHILQRRGTSRTSTMKTARPSKRSLSPTPKRTLINPTETQLLQHSNTGRTDTIVTRRRRGYKIPALSEKEYWNDDAYSQHTHSDGITPLAIDDSHALAREPTAPLAHLALYARFESLPRDTGAEPTHCSRANDAERR